MTLTPRAKYIIENYRLEQTSDGWRAVSMYAGKVWSEKFATTREEAVRLARVWWGHFNFQDEAEAFNSIFR